MVLGCCRALELLRTVASSFAKKTQRGSPSGTVLYPPESGSTVCVKTAACQQLGVAQTGQSPPRVRGAARSQAGRCSTATLYGSRPVSSEPGAAAQLACFIRQEVTWALRNQVQIVGP